MVQMGKVLVLGQAFYPGNGKWAWQLFCVLVWAELSPAAGAPRVVTYTGQQPGEPHNSWASDATRLYLVLPMCARAAQGCLQTG